jgi:hypothetical protein
MPSKTTTDHHEIRRWASAHGGKPACIAGTGGKGDPGMLPLMFPDSPLANDENLRELAWDEWLRRERSRLGLRRKRPLQQAGVASLR